VTRESHPKVLLPLFDRFNESWVLYLHWRRVCGNRSTRSAVHELRRSIRRLRAILRLIGRLNGDWATEAGRVDGKLTRELRDSSRLRDLQVMEKGVSASDRSLDVYRSNLAHSAKRERKSFERFLKDRGHERTQARVERVNKGLLLRAGRPSSERSARRRLMSAVKKSRDDIRKKTGRARSNDPSSIHEVRIAFKKRRYTLEALEFLVSGGSVRRKNLENAQNILGQIQDTYVEIKYIEEYLRRCRGRQSKALREALEMRLTRLCTERQLQSEGFLAGHSSRVY
jgi:CHAD domain-containing protein